MTPRLHRPASAVLVTVLVALPIASCAGGSGQLGGLGGDIGTRVGGVASRMAGNSLRGDPPITTSLPDAVWAVDSLDNFISLHDFASHVDAAFSAPPNALLDEDAVRHAIEQALADFAHARIGAVVGAVPFAHIDVGGFAGAPPGSILDLGNEHSGASPSYLFHGGSIGAIP